MEHSCKSCDVENTSPRRYQGQLVVYPSTPLAIEELYFSASMVFLDNERSRNVRVVKLFPSINTFVTRSRVAQKHGGVGFDSSPSLATRHTVCRLRFSHRPLPCRCGPLFYCVYRFLSMVVSSHMNIRSTGPGPEWEILEVLSASQIHVRCPCGSSFFFFGAFLKHEN